MSKKQTTSTVRVGTKRGLRANELEVTITMRGDPTKVVDALVHGLPRSAITQIYDAMGAELARATAAPRRRRASR